MTQDVLICNWIKQVFQILGGANSVKKSCLITLLCSSTKWYLIVIVTAAWGIAKNLKHCDIN